MTGYVPRIPPRNHQKEAVNKAGGREAFAYLMDMGTGKSATELLEFGKLWEAKQAMDLLILAPAGCYRNWDGGDSVEDGGEFAKHLAPELYDQLSVGAFRAGMGNRRKEALDRLLQATGPRALLVNVEALATVGKAEELCREFLSRRRGLICVDESPVIKNHIAQRTKVIQQLGGLAPYRRIMSGLVTPNSPMDLFSQFEFLNWRILGQRNFFAYRSKYAILKTLDAPKGNPDEPPGKKRKFIVGFRNQSELRARIEPFSYRKLKEECLDLPPKIYMPIRYVDLTNEQMRVYREMRDTAYSRLEAGGTVSAGLAITMMLRLHQIVCGFVTDDEGKVRALENNRTRAVLEVLAEHQRKAVIWTCYDACVRDLIDKIGKEYGPHSVAAFWGGNKSTRGEDERRFKGDPECRFMVSTQAAGGRGNTWVCADLAVYHASTHNLEHRAQSEDRTHRDGQTLSAVYQDLVTPDTVDMPILHALRKKINMAAEITGDNWKQWVI